MFLRVLRLARRCAGGPVRFPSQHYLRRFIGYDLSFRRTAEAPQ